MNQEAMVLSVLQQSNLNVVETLSNLASKLKSQVQHGTNKNQAPPCSQDLFVLQELLICIAEKQDTTDADCKAILSMVTNEVCLPLLKLIHPSIDSNTDDVVLLGAVARLMSECVILNCQLLTDVLTHVERNLATYLKEKPTHYDLQHDGSMVDIQCILEVLRHILNKVSRNQNSVKSESNLTVFRKLFNMVLHATDIIPSELMSRLCVPVMGKMLSIDESQFDKNITEIWKIVEAFYASGDLRKAFLFLCGFANYFFPTSESASSFTICKDDNFWKILQSGLSCKDSVNRKRALYLLKRVVDACESYGLDVNAEAHNSHMFWWSKEKSSELSKTWEDFILLAEVLEEKQVHVIKPLLPRMKSLIKACTFTGTQAIALLHTSWLKTIFLRCSHHESLQVIRWAADCVLSLDLHQCPMIQQGLYDYLTDEMLNSLQEAKLYFRESGAAVGSMPCIADKLVHFYHECWATLPNDRKGGFFNQILRNICSREWGQVALLFICRGLSLLPQSPCLDRDTVLSVRKMLTGYLVGVDTYFRGAIQGYIVKILISLTDKSLVPLEDFLQIVSLVSREDCLQRGTILWSSCVTWLKQDMDDGQSDWSSKGMQLYLDKSLTKYLETQQGSKFSTADSAPALMLARLLVMSSESDDTSASEEDGYPALKKACQTLASVLNAINTHAYMSTHKADKALLLLKLLVKELGPRGAILDEPVAKVIMLCVQSCQTEIIEYITRQILEVIANLSDVALLELYTDSVKLLALLSKSVSGINFNKLVDVCVNCLQRTDSSQMSGVHVTMQQLGSICIVGSVAHFLSETEHVEKYDDIITIIIDFVKSWKIVTNLPKPKSETKVRQQDWGSVVSLFLEHEWHVIKMAVQYSAAPWCDYQQLLELAGETLSVGVEETCFVVLHALRLIVPKVVVCGNYSEDQLVSILEASWSSYQEARRILAYWEILAGFVHVAYLPCLLAMPESSPVIQKLTHYAERLMETDRNGVVNMLADQLYAALTQPGMMEHAAKFSSILVQLCVYGGLVRRGIRQVYDICAALEATGTECSANGLVPVVKNEDMQVKVATISLLCHLDPSNHQHCCLATSIVRLCSERYMVVLEGSFNRFANSLYHRQRHRYIQTILLLQSFLQQEALHEIWEFAWCSLEVEIHASVRHMLEWIVIWCMYRHKHHRVEIWDKFDKYRDTKNITMCSLLCIIIHLGPHLPKEEQETFYSNSLKNILPWCMAHHFHTRIYSQATLVKLWDQINTLGLHDLCKQNAILQCIVDFNQKNCNSTSNVKKLLDSFFFKFLDFKNDFTLETIYHVMPRMTDLTEEDWISPELFSNYNPSWRTHGPKFIGLCNNTEKFSNCDPSVWKYVSVKIHDDEDSGGAAGDTGGVNGRDESDVQKKIMPWRQMMMEEDVLAEIDYGIKQAPGGGLVVVTSLISKVPNLGGLCRTSEIFGVSEYVLGRLQYVEDRSFQSLSVTAQKWVPITEVHETKLANFLQEKKQEGYTLVGVEQTANSVCLTEYDFPTKTLLLLGNEKEGIPVELISLLDVCVEIPQQGIIRSLNVHVSGALIIWEYRRQQIMKAAQS